jgi:acetoacetyl-CoA synthetase
MTPLWTPSPQRASQSQMQRLIALAGAADYASLHRWSLQQPAAFWSLLWQALGIKGERNEPVLEHAESMLEARFFPAAWLNVTANLLTRHDDGIAVICVNESGQEVAYSWRELQEKVRRCANALTAVGIGPGDRVAAWLPLGLEALVLLLAAGAIGAIYSSSSPDFGAVGVLERFGQIAPKLLVASSSYRYGGKDFDGLARLTEVQDGLPSLLATVIVGADTMSANTTLGQNWDEWLAVASDEALAMPLFPFNYPWFILYSSGTTGKPKCIVHKTGGVLLNVAKEQRFHCDIDQESRLLYFTTTGWMMYNWLVCALQSGASIVLYDGNPFTPGPMQLFCIAERLQVTHLGVSAKLLDAVAKTGRLPQDECDLTHLRCLLSTGSPLSPERFAWVYQAIKADVHLASISGGTDLCGCFLLGNPILPVYAGQLQGPALGMALDIWDEAGAGCTIGQPGELVCTQAFPAQPLGFWQDPSGARYRAAYFEKFATTPPVWAHGDFASRTAEGGMVIHGRSDATLNPGGVRIGTSEIYRAIEDLPAVLEGLVFGQQWQNDVRIVLLVRLSDGITLTPALIDSIKQRIRLATTPRHVPALVLAVADLPRTRSGKLVELAVSDLVNGRSVRNIEALANPEALWAIAERSELQT